MKKKISAGFIVTVLAGILAAVAIALYGSVPYTQEKVTCFLIGAVALTALSLLLTLSVGYRTVLGVVPVVNSVLCALAAVYGAELMVNQIAYVYTGLDPMSSIRNWIVYTGVVVAALLLNIIASFLKQAREA